MQIRNSVTNQIVFVLFAPATLAHLLGQTRTFDLDKSGVCTNTWHRYICNGRPLAEAILKKIAEHVEWHHYPGGAGWVGSKTLNKVLAGQDGFIKVVVREAPNNKVDLIDVYMLGEDDEYTGQQAIKCNPVSYEKHEKHSS